MLFELHDIAEEIRGYADHMAALNRAYVHNAFFEACEDFIRKHDDIFFSCRHVQDNIQEKFYQLLKADEVIKIFVEALKETLVDMEKTGKAESSQRVDEDLSLSLSRGFASPLYQYPGSQEKIERSSVSDQDTDVQNRESRDGTFRV
jgi:hypothetical protein